MKKAIVLDIDDTLTTSSYIGRNNISYMCLRTNFNFILNALRKAKKNNIDIILCTAAFLSKADKLFNLSNELKEIVDDIYGRENMEYINGMKAVFNFDYDKILFIDDLEEEKNMYIDYFFKNNLKIDFTFYQIEKPIVNNKDILYNGLLNDELIIDKNINIVKEYIKVLKDEPFAKLAADKINNFINDSSFDFGLKVLDEKNNKDVFRYKNKVNELTNMLFDIDDDFLFKGQNLEKRKFGKDFFENFTKDKISIFEGLDKINPKIFT